MCEKLALGVNDGRVVADRSVLALVQVPPPDLFSHTKKISGMVHSRNHALVSEIAHSGFADEITLVIDILGREFGFHYDWNRMTAKVSLLASF